MPALKIRNPNNFFRHFERSLDGAMRHSRATRKNPGDDRLRRTEKSHRSLELGKLPARMSRIHQKIILSTALRNLEIASFATKREITALEKVGMQYLYACTVRNQMLNMLREKFGNSEGQWPAQKEKQFDLLVRKSVEEQIQLRQCGNSILENVGNEIVQEIDELSWLVSKMMRD